MKKTATIRIIPWLGSAALLFAAGTGARAAVVAHHETHQVRSASPAKASGPAPAGWSAAQCGREPAAPAVDVSTVDRYNSSVDRVTAYEKAARAYNACVSREATAQQTAISNEARARIDSIQSVSSALQKRIASNFTTLTDQLRAAGPKLQAGPAGR